MGPCNMPGLEKLEAIIASHAKAVVAYSGGVDSSLLLRLCRDVLGEKNVLAVTGVSLTYTEEEKREASRFTAELGRLLEPGTVRGITSHLKSLGYLWVALDMEGYRTGSLNRAVGTRPAGEDDGAGDGK